MRSDAILACVTLGTVAVLVTGCSQAPPPPFTNTAGEATAPQVEYPAGPYGIGVGSVIADFNFVGYADASTTQATMQALALSDFYNPHGRTAGWEPAAGEADDRLFPVGTSVGVAGQPKPTALLIDVACVWCVPCNDEAGGILPAKYATYAPCGGEFMLDLHDSDTPGTAASPTNLRDWTTKYKVNYPAAIDPSYQLDKLFGVQAFPNNFIIDTTTMNIVANFAGEAAPGTCNDGANEVSLCTVDADCQICTGGTCGDGTTCTANSDCASKTCTEFPFWTTYESLLDKTRTGCTLSN